MLVEGYKLDSPSLLVKKQSKLKIALRTVSWILSLLIYGLFRVILVIAERELG